MKDDEHEVPDWKSRLAGELQMALKATAGAETSLPVSNEITWSYAKEYERLLYGLELEWGCGALQTRLTGAGGASRAAHGGRLDWTDGGQRKDKVEKDTLTSRVFRPQRAVGGRSLLS